MAVVKKKEKKEILTLKPDNTNVDIGGEGKKNIGDDSCGYYESFQTKYTRKNVLDNKVTPKIRKWDLISWKKDLARNQKMTVLSDDPFDMKNWSSFQTRYIASIVEYIYPDKQKFHARRLHYHLLQTGHCFPYRIKKKSPIWELRKYDGSTDSWTALQKYLKTARYAGLIPMWKQMDMRTTSVVEPVGFEVKREIVKDTQTMDFDFKLSTGDNLKIDLETPVIVFYTEKSEMVYILKPLTKKFYLGYFIAQGYPSISNSRDIYEFIKAHGKSGIILTLTDYDRYGQQIAHTVARHIQYFVQNEPDTETAPNIVVYPFKITKNDAKEFELLGLPMQLKKTKDGKTSMIYELIALEMLAVNHKMTLEEYIERELKRIFFFDIDPMRSWLVLRNSFKKYYTKEKNRMFAGLTSKLKEIAKGSETQLEKEKLSITPSTTYRNFEKAVKSRMEDLEGYKILKRTTQTYQFEPTHLKIEPSPLTKKERKEKKKLGYKDGKTIVGNEWGFHKKGDTKGEYIFEWESKKESGKKGEVETITVPIGPLDETKIKERSILWFGDNKVDVKTPTIKMNQWIEENEKKNPDFNIKNRKRFDKHIANIQNIFNSMNITKSLAGKEKENELIGEFAKARDKPRKKDETTLQADERRTEEKEKNYLSDLMNEINWESPYPTYSKWVKDNPSYILDELDNIRIKEDVFKKVGDEPPRYIGMTIKRLKSEPGLKNSKNLERFFKQYFNWMVPFYKKSGEALQDDKVIERKAKGILKRCIKSKIEYCEPVVQVVKYRDPKTISVKGRKIKIIKHPKLVAQYENEVLNRQIGRYQSNQ